jgi:hypothetical protein
VAGADSNSKLNEANKFAAPRTAWRKAIYLELHLAVGRDDRYAAEAVPNFRFPQRGSRKPKKENATFDVELAR